MKKITKLFRPALRKAHRVTFWTANMRISRVRFTVDPREEERKNWWLNNKNHCQTLANHGTAYSVTSQDARKATLSAESTSNKNIFRVSNMSYMVNCGASKLFKTFEIF